MRIHFVLFALLFPFLTMGQSPCDVLNADFTWTNTGNGVQFSNGTTGTGEPTTWLWSFGDNTGHTAAQPFHTYSQPGTYEVCLTVISAYEVNGNFVTCQDTACSFVQVGGDPCSTMQACFVTNELGNGNFFFDNCTSGPLGTQLFWDFGDGTQSTVTNVEHHFEEPGTYTVCLFAYWQNCADTTCTTITVTGDNPCDNLNANFIWSGGVNGVNFANEVIDNTWTYLWHFGDGATTYGANPLHTYPAPGIYEACLTVWTWDPVAQDTCFQLHCEMITVAGSDPCLGLNADFSSSTTPNGTQFSNATTGTGIQTSYSWTFGDGSGSVDAQPFHTYPAPGSYEACLQVLTIFELPGGELHTCFDTTCTTVIIGGGDPCDDLEACFVPNDLGGGNFFFDNCTNNPLGTQYSWDFGDGSQTTTTHGEHHYDQLGTYTVCLFAYWENCVDSTCTTISVIGDSPCDSLNANFTWGGEINGVNFGNEVIDNAWTYLWHFGDGTTAYGANPFHIYPVPGAYEACLTVWTWDPTTQDSCFADHCEMITVFDDSPCAELLAGMTWSVVGSNTIQFNGTTNFPADGVVWSFGDGQDGYNSSETHTYSAAGEYFVCFSAYRWNIQTQDTCWVEDCRMVYVGINDPCDDLQACYVTNLLPNNGVFLDNCSTGPPNMQFSWSYGDGSSSTTDYAEHYYDQPGTYTVCLIVFTQDCADTLCTTVVIGDSLDCNGFTTSFEVDVTGNAAVFYGQSSIPADGMSWSFGDGTFGEGSPVTHLYEPLGPYEVCLDSWYWNEATQDSCYAHSCQTIDLIHVGIGPLLSPDAFNLYPQPAHDRLTITGAALSTPLQARFFGMDGKLEQQEQVNTLPHHVDISSLAPAVHVLQLELNGQRFNYRVAVE